jgi:hypothetical protein
MWRGIKDGQYIMDSANERFKACFLTIGDQVQNIGKNVNIIFDDLIKCFQKDRVNDPAFSGDGNEHPHLMVFSFNEQQDNLIQALPVQDLIFLLGSQQSALFSETRHKLISGNKCSFLFTLILSENGDVGRRYPSSNNESIIFFDDRNAQERIVQLVKDICRVWMFPRLLSCGLSCMSDALSNTNGRILSFESQTLDYLPSFHQFLSDNLKTIQRASGIFFIVSSNSGNDFSIRNHLQQVIDEIENVVNSEGTVIGSDSLYAESEVAFRVTMICGKK